MAGEVARPVAALHGKDSRHLLLDTLSGYCQPRCHPRHAFRTKTELSKNDFQRMLVLLQQAAVNLSLSELRDGGILAVNGPPGTGKTTLLRDIAAALITERARVMSREAVRLRLYPRRSGVPAPGWT